ncbi:Polynucleotide 5'-hydroxyl-kinase grc3 [Talaromyces atroroseus]|uniref:Polynucleotide 5'-hydroxyl-kinase GRC3 n=1 Tax=Talaromyces atroroseus TaxID=1441469 RepID=A0A1Q5Q9H5_TALAT|nr:Polynucleotide 5'-hydroxyl-kinase grc3 [Talaromyces atroroseus]OKL60783.1 Polynucleotide 5'-hydroxyl-kinase grc3 [Talaromyces atroroseus]
MKRKAEKQQSSVPRSAVSAIAARRARQQEQEQQQQDQSSQRDAPDVDRETEYSVKRVRSSPTRERTENNRPAISEDLTFEPSSIDDTEALGNESSENEEAIIGDQVIEEGSQYAENDEDDETSSRLAASTENFTLSKHKLRKSDVVYSDEHMLCVRLREHTVRIRIIDGLIDCIYDIWVKRGVISVMGAKLHPSPNTYRVYAPSTHSLPVIKCVSGVEGYAEVELQSCSSNLCRLKNLSPHYARIWNSTETVGDCTTLRGNSYKRSFSIVLLCGPKGTGKSTFGRYLLNHLLTPAPPIGKGFDDLDGVAFLDLDPGQPEFAPMGNIYLAHLREPCFGPPFSHSNLEGSRHGKIVRCHHIGATSPKEDPDNYALAIMNLLDQYQVLLATYPRCPLIINFPGWIFGLGLEVATWLIRSVGLSDVVYMSEKGPREVAEPLSQAASEAQVTFTALPSQPVDLVTRSSAQLRSMQMQSYFHMTQPEGSQNPFWSDSPLIHSKPICVSYTGSQPGISGIMVLGNHYSPSVLRDITEGSIVAVVAIENANAIPGASEIEVKPDGNIHAADGDINTMDEDETSESQNTQQTKKMLGKSIVRCPDSGLPYLFCGAGSNTPLCPKASRSLGLALVRSVEVSSHTLELVSPVPSSFIHEAINQGQSLVLVRGMIDSPDWTFTEEYYAARNAEQDYIMSISHTKKKRGEEIGGLKEEDDDKKRQQNEHLRRLQERVRRASKMPYLNVIEEASVLHYQETRQEYGTWKLRKKAYTHDGDIE